MLKHLLNPLLTHCRYVEVLLKETSLCLDVQFLQENLAFLVESVRIHWFEGGFEDLVEEVIEENIPVLVLL